MKNAEWDGPISRGKATVRHGQTDAFLWSSLPSRNENNLLFSLIDPVSMPVSLASCCERATAWFPRILVAQIFRFMSWIETIRPEACSGERAWLRVTAGWQPCHTTPCCRTGLVEESSLQHIPTILRKPFFDIFGPWWGTHCWG